METLNQADEITDVLRFGVEIARTQFQASPTVSPLTRGGQHHHRNAIQSTVAPERTEDLQAIRPRHVEVKQHEIGQRS